MNRPLPVTPRHVGRSEPAETAPRTDLAAVDDLEYGVELLAALPLHANRTRTQLRSWAAAATAFGEALEPTPREAAPRVVEVTGGWDRGLLARYTSRPPTVELFTDSLAAAEELVAAHGWRSWFPAGSLRTAALAHEAVHARLHHGPERTALKQALGHTALRLGRLRVLAHVAGAEEIAAHAHARVVCDLGRSPLLLSAALTKATQQAPREK